MDGKYTIYIYMYIYIYIYVHTYIHTYIHIYVCTYIHILVKFDIIEILLDIHGRESQGSFIYVYLCLRSECWTLQDELQTEAGGHDCLELNRSKD